MNWLLMFICLILIAIIGYLIYLLIKTNKRIEYYKKLDKWRKK
jgi:uncharacterized integral membrane protein